MKDPRRPSITGTKHLESLTYLTPTQVAELLQVHPETIRRKIRKGELPGVEHHAGVTRIRTSVLLGSDAA